MPPTNPSSVQTSRRRWSKPRPRRIPFILLGITFIPLLLASCSERLPPSGDIPGPHFGYPALFEPTVRRYETPIRAFVGGAGNWTEVPTTESMKNDLFLQDPGAAISLGYSIRLDSPSGWTMMLESGQQKGSSYERSESGPWRFRDPRWANSVFFVSVEEFHLRVHSVAFELRDSGRFRPHGWVRRYYEPGTDPLLAAEGLDGDTLVLRVFDEVMVGR